MLLNTCFVTLFYASAIPILYLLAALAFLSLYIASFIVFKYFSCKPIMFDHTLNNVISKVLCLALALHQITNVFFFYTEDIFPIHSLQKGYKYAFWHKFSQGTGYLIFSFLIVLFALNYSFVCNFVRKIYRRYCEADGIKRNNKKAKLFSEIFKKSKVPADIGAQGAGMNEYLSSYRMEDNPLYVELCYALSILSKFQPYFSVSIS